MTILLQQQCYRNTANNATVYVEKYMDKFSVPLWRVLYHRDQDSNPVCFAHRSGLLRKPSKRQVRRYLETI